MIAAVHKPVSAFRVLSGTTFEAKAPYPLPGNLNGKNGLAKWRSKKVYQPKTSRLWRSPA